MFRDDENKPLIFDRGMLYDPIPGAADAPRPRVPWAIPLTIVDPELEIAEQVKQNSAFIIESLLWLAKYGQNVKVQLDALQTLLKYGWGGGEAQSAPANDPAPGPPPMAPSPPARALPLHRMTKQELDALAIVQAFQDRIEREEG